MAMTERQGNTHTHTEIITITAQQPDVGQAKARSQELYSYKGGRDPSTWAFFDCLPVFISRKLDWRCSSWDLNWHSGSLSLCTSTLAFPCVLSASITVFHSCMVSLKCISYSIAPMCIPSSLSKQWEETAHKAHSTVSSLKYVALCSSPTSSIHPSPQFKRQRHRENSTLCFLS